MQLRSLVNRLSSVALALSLAFAATAHLRAQDADNPAPEKHGRKYKAPPDTSHIEVTVVKGFNKKPIDGAHVIFHPIKDGEDEGNLEVKTHQDGKVSIDVIPTGSKVTIQVLADGFSTYAEDYQVNEASREITIAMQKPREQISTYQDNYGKPSQMAPGAQVPVRPKKSGAAPTGSATTTGQPAANTTAQPASGGTPQQ
jgi:hypothetical protein